MSNSGQHDPHGSGVLSVKMLENCPSGVLLRNGVIGLNSDDSDTNPLKPRTVAERSKRMAMANHLVD